MLVDRTASAGATDFTKTSLLRTRRASRSGTPTGLGVSSGKGTSKDFFCDGCDACFVAQRDPEGCVIGLQVIHCGTPGCCQSLPRAGGCMEKHSRALSG